MYRYGRAQGYTTFQAFEDGISTYQPRVMCERKTFLHTLIILLQSRHNVAKIWSLRGVRCPTALDEVCKCWLTTRRQWRPFILQHKNETVRKFLQETHFQHIIVRQALKKEIEDLILGKDSSGTNRKLIKEQVP